MREYDAAWDEVYGMRTRSRGRPSRTSPTTSNTCATSPASITSAIGADFYGERVQHGDGARGYVASYPRLFAELIRRGWNEEMLAKLARGNLLRAMREAERAAARLQQARPASFATIEQLDGGKAQPDKL